MTLFEDITIAAVLGTGRQPFSAPPVDGKLGGLLSQLGSRDPEDALLTSAALVSVYERAGAVPPRLERPLPQASPEDTAPQVGARGADLLAQMLGGARREILMEGLNLMADRGLRVPHHLLPDLLSLGARSGEYRKRILPIIGKRGQWLASMNPEWDYARGVNLTLDFTDTEAVSGVWEEGSRDARAAFLRDLRQERPAVARELIQQTWSSEPADTRSAFLQTLADGLSHNDESFLEQALDDRSKEVRRTAADLLARLAGSQFGERMWMRAKPLIRIRRRLMGGPVLEIELPGDPDAAALRDGIDPALKVGGLGDKAALLAQIVSAVEPSRWATELGEPPARLLDLALKTEWADALVLSWTRAANRTGDAAWLESLTRNFLQSDRVKSWSPENIPDIDLLPASRIEALLGEALANGNPDESNPVWTLLPRYRGTFGPALCQAMINAVSKRVKGNASDAWSLGRYIHELALRVPPETAAAEMIWPEETLTGYLKNAVEEFRVTLEFRAELWKELH